jgi:predicted DNA-binding protein (UPF0251 family)
LSEASIVSPAHADGLAVDRDEQQATRAAWLYFVGGLTQVQIAKRLGVNRVRVNRLLAQARDQGLVQIRVTGRLADCIGLEEKLKELVLPWPNGWRMACRLASAGAARSGFRFVRCRAGI